jgi:signal transduction histidine kinase
MFKLKSSLSRRILLIVIGGFVTMAALLLLLGYQLLWPDLQRILITQQQEGADRTAHRIEEAIAERKEAMANLATMLHDGEKLKDAKSVQVLLDERILLHKYFNGGLNVIDSTGHIWVDSPIHPGRQGVDLSDRDYIQKAFETKEALLAPPLIGRGLDTPVFIIVVPILNDAEKILGVLFGVTRLADENLLHEIARQSFSQEGALYIVDTKLDIIVTASDTTLSMASARHAPIAEILEAIDAGQSSGVARRDDGARLLYASASPAGVNWRVIRTLPHEEAFAPLYKMLTPFILTALGLLIVLTVLTLLLLRHQLRPLKDTADTLDAVLARKHPTRSLPVVRHDEIGRLINSFNRIIQLRTVQKAKMIKAQERLKATLDSLQDQVDEAVRKTQEQERTISEQSRRHALLNLLVNLAHQWRQPLNAAGLLVQELEEDYHQGELTAEQMHTQVDRVMAQLRGLSETITHFTELYQSNGEVTTVALEAIVARVEDLLGQRLKNSNLKLTTDLPTGYFIRICPADLVEILIELLENILTTARRRGLKSVTASLSAHYEGAWLTLTLHDNAGGFDSRLLPTLFDPYAIEGYKAAGRGLGLFHLHELITGYYRGQMRAQNHESGAEVILILPVVVQSETIKEGT